MPPSKHTDMAPEQLRSVLGSGLLSFPSTAFDADLAFDEAAYRNLVHWQSRSGAAALFAAGGTGEFFSLTPDEVPRVVAAAKAEAGDVRVLAGCGYGTELAINMAHDAERAGADGLLLLPHYLIGSEQEGVYQHVKRVCDAIDIGVVVYNRDNSVLQPETLERLCAACPNLIGFKDGLGDVDLISRVVTRLGDRLTYIGGMPTAELYAEAYAAIGVTTYSSAVYNFAPELASTFYQALQACEHERLRKMLRDFFHPYAEIRDRRRGYAVSIVKAGLRLVDRDAGPVRPPLTDLTDDEHRMLGSLLETRLS